MVRRIIFVFLLAAIGLGTVRAAVSETAAERVASQYAAHELSSYPRHSNLPDYALSPPTLTKALALGRVRIGFFFIGTVLSLLLPWILLASGSVARIRDELERRIRFRWLRAPLLLLACLVVLRLASFPLSAYGHHIGVAYGLSVQSWGSWLADLAKSFAIDSLVACLLTAIVYELLCRFPRRWWWMFWSVAAPLTLLAVTFAPITLDPLFNHFEPLALHHPALSAQLERMGVPRSRQFLMQASAKVTTPNAYVTGLGPTKRIVVWDTEIGRDGDVTSETLWTVGHECGHFVLNHVLFGTLLTMIALLPVLWLVSLALQALVLRYGSRWRIVSVADPAALAVLLLIANIVLTIADPISNAVSRRIEHSADIYGEEAIHGLVPDPQAAVRAACASMGARIFDDPNPSPWVEFLLENHPTTSRRAAFGKAYDPWAPGMEPRYFKSRR